MNNSDKTKRLSGQKNYNEDSPCCQQWIVLQMS